MCSLTSVAGCESNAIEPSYGKGDRLTDSADEGWLYSCSPTETEQYLSIGAFQNPTEGNDCYTSTQTLDVVGTLIADVELFGYTDAGFSESHTSSNISINRIGGPCPAEQGGSLHFENQCDPHIEWYSNTGAQLESCGGASECAAGMPDACVGQYQAIHTRAVSTFNCSDLSHNYLDVLSEDPCTTDYTSTAAECVPGTGTFVLAPWRYDDFDLDGLLHATLVPIKVSGTGTMTKTAWVTSITPLSVPTGWALDVVDSTIPLRVDKTDHVRSPSTTVSVPGQTSFSAGLLRGMPTFVAQEAPPSTTMPTVQMNWTCGAPANDVTRVLGYQLRLSDLGCGYDQKVTFRYASSPNRLSAELYGMPMVAQLEPTVTTSEGLAFAYEKSGVFIDGVLLSHDANQMVIRFDTIEYGGVPVCTTGTYTLVPE